ncbi:hypothetical protein BW721_00860 [Jeotgalibaca sp. PTS2502]|nr:YvrJ family protein [Jeotgalibaca sp. PTS2502]APZ48353.1 hypothetical protein BW721_00860 [Jeotgalibaca sp. PTS2502]
MDQYMELISNTGFPIVVSLYLLSRMEKKLDSLVNAIDKLCESYTTANKR